MVLDLALSNAQQFRQENLSAMEALLDAYPTMPPESRQRVDSRVTPQTGWDLICRARSFAERAVREKSAAHLFRGITALVVEQLTEAPRDNLRALCLLHHSALKIGLDPNHLFRFAEKFAKPEVAAFLMGYLAEGEKDITAMGYVESSDADGFRYENV
jgi:hypothetical protein